MKSFDDFSFSSISCMSRKHPAMLPVWVVAEPCFATSTNNGSDDLNESSTSFFLALFNGLCFFLLNPCKNPDYMKYAVGIP